MACSRTNFTFLPLLLSLNKERNALWWNKRKNGGKKRKGKTLCKILRANVSHRQHKTGITIESAATEIELSLRLLHFGIWNAAFSSSETTCTKRHAYMRVEECLLMYVGLSTCNFHDTRQSLLHTHTHTHTISKLSVSAVFSFIT
jgi:hypothetical protein